MPETLPKRRREKYSKLICLGCRARRIRCALPDTDIQPSSQPQPPDKACQRCQQNGLDCIVDHTTLGRPAQKRNRIDQASNVQQTNEQSDSRQPVADFEEIVSHDVEDYLLSRPETISDGTPVARAQQQAPTKSEMFEAVFSPFHLLSALLARDKKFASSIGSQPLVNVSIADLIDDHVAALLDDHLVWHKLYYPDIPSLPSFRGQVECMERGRPDRPAMLFLFTLLCDLALEVPSTKLASCRSLQPAVRALLFHTGQQLLFSLSNSRYSVISMVLASQYRPLVFTSSQIAAANALKAVPYTVFAKQVAMELSYSTAGTRLTDALQSSHAETDELLPIMHECLHWVRLSMAGISLDTIFRLNLFEDTTLQCLEALKAALLLGQMPVELLLPFYTTSCWIRMMLNFKELSENWRDLEQLGRIINSHKASCDREEETLERSLAGSGDRPERLNVISCLVAGERHLAHTGVVGAALFFAVMCGAFSASNQTSVQPDQAIQIGEHIIDQLTTHKEEDPNRPSHRKFLEEYGHNRMSELERVLSNFITSADTLKLTGIPYVGATRSTVSFILFTCKDIVEGQAARLKGWGGLDDRVDVQMILFHECARRLEAMSSSAGTEEAMAKGCTLTASAKLIRSLHRIMQGFKRTVTMSNRRSTSESTKQNSTPASGGHTSALDDPTSTSSGWDSLIADDVFADWDNWPQFDAFDFTDLFGNAFSWDPSSSF